MSTGGSFGADWMVGMHDHFSRTGEYRGDDVRRLLGDQRHAFNLIAGTVEHAPCHDQPVEAGKKRAGKKR